MMRKFLLALVAFTGAVLVQGSADAGERQFLFFAWDDGQPTYSQPQYQSSYQYSEQPAVQYYGQPPQPTYTYEQRPGLFQQLVDIENRKNAWLRRTFFGGY